MALPSPPCSLLTYPPEGWLTTNGSVTQLLCRDEKAPGPQTLVTTAFDAAAGAWTPPAFFAEGLQPLRWTIEPVTGDAWLLAAGGSGPASGGTAGNGGAPNLFYVGTDPTSGRRAPPVLLYNGTAGNVVLQDLAYGAGLYCLGRVNGAPSAGGVTLIQTGVAGWPLDALPRQLLPLRDPFPWLPGTLAPRYAAAFAPPLVPSNPVLGIATYSAPPSLEVWVRPPGVGNWTQRGIYPVRSLGNQVVARVLAPAGAEPGTFLLISRKWLASVNSAGTDTLLFPNAPPGALIYQDAGLAQMIVSPTPTALPSPSSRPTKTLEASRSATGSSSASASASSPPSSSALPSLLPDISRDATPTGIWSLTATGSASATASVTTTQKGVLVSLAATPSGSATASPSLSGSASRWPSVSASTSASARPYVLPSPSLSSTPSPNATAGGGAAAAAALSPSEARDLGLGLGIPSLLLVIAAVLVGCFGREMVRRAWVWIRLRCLGKGIRVPPRRAPYPSRAGSVMRPIEQPGVLHVSMNPALVQQQTTLDILNLARQQRLEAMAIQQREVAAEGAAATRRPLSILRVSEGVSQRTLQQFKISYAPQRATGSSV